MSNYTKTTDFEAKDSLPSGDSGKIIRGSEFETEFDNIAIAIASKSDANNPTFTGTVTIDGLTVNGNTVLGNAATDTVTVTADIASNLLPSADDTYNLGAVGAEWNDLFIDGVANIDSLVADTADINGGTVDGVTSVSLSSGNLTLPDNSKAIFGAGSDLQIYHDGSNSFINEAGTGSLYIGAESEIQLRSYSTNEKFLVGTSNGATSLYYNGVRKLDTTNTGIDVTGTVTADGLAVDGNATISSAAPVLNLTETDTTNLNTLLESSSGNLNISTRSDDGGTKTKRMRITHSTGDISFYEDTGTTAKFFWDASAERLGLGTDSPAEELHIAAGYPVIRLEDSDSTGNAYAEIQSSNGDLYLMADQGQDTGSSKLSLWVDASERMRITNGGHLLVGKTAQDSTNTVGFEAKDDGLTVATTDGAQSLVLNRKTSDGTIAEFRKDNSAVGTISAASTNIIYGNDTRGLKIEDTLIIPRDIDDTTADNQMDLGSSTSRWKDLYLSGGVIGDTFGTSTNKLSYSIANTARIFTGGSERMRIDSGGKVGIGTSSPVATLAIKGSVNELDIETTTAGVTLESIDRSDLNAQSDLSYYARHGEHKFFGSSYSERMRIDSSGNLLVGTTSAVVANSSSNVGTAIGAGLIESARAGVVAQFNRHTSDGEIIDFQKAGTTVGTIGTTLVASL